NQQFRFAPCRTARTKCRQGSGRCRMSNTASNTPLDRQDVRVRNDEGVAGAISGFIDRVRTGDLGSLPVIVGLAIIWTVFQSLNPVFLSSNNLVNLLFDCSTIGVISLGIVCVL